MNLLESDYEMRRTIWDSKIPIEFVLDVSHILRPQQSSSFMMLPRVSYFPLYLDEPLRTFEAYDSQEENPSNAWLQHNGEILRWHYPVGVLYDMYNTTSTDKATLPWVVTIRLKDFPQELVRCLSKDAMKFIFIQSLKEASQIKHKHNIVSSMTSEEHARLFDSFANEKFDEFWSLNERLMKLTTNDNELVNVPLRFYMQSIPFRQLLFPWRQQQENGEFAETTLSQALRKAFPDYESLGEKYAAISHGIELPCESSIAWMAKNFSYPDNFVHIVLRIKKA